jgi:membrane fusion protein (multidrug efflux system)
MTIYERVIYLNTTLKPVPADMPQLLSIDLPSPRAALFGRKHRATTILLAALLLGALALSGCKGGPQGADSDGKGKNGEDAKKPDPVPVEAVRISRRPIAASYTGTAPLEARGESQVVAKTSGVALQVMAEVGQQVRAGQVLVRLDSARAVLQAAQSEAQLRKLEANYRRSQQLFAQQLVSANDLDQLRFDVENIRAVNRLANLELSYANVTAPISGVIAERSIKTGNFVQINSPIFRIVDTSRLEAVLNVPERELITLKAGLPVQLSVDALPGKPFQGRVDRIAPVIDSGSGTFRVICAFEGGGLLQPGMFGRIRIDYDQRADAPVIPRSALLDDENDPSVFTVRNGKAVRTPIKLGYYEGEWVEVRGGLKPDDRVVTAGKVALRDGSEVQVIGDPKPKTVAAAKPAGAKQ